MIYSNFEFIEKEVKKPLHLERIERLINKTNVVMFGPRQTYKTTFAMNWIVENKPSKVAIIGINSITNEYPKNLLKIMNYDGDYMFTRDIEKIQTYNPDVIIYDEFAYDNKASEIFDGIAYCIKNGTKFIGISTYCNNAICHNIKTKEIGFEYDVYQVHLSELPKKLQDRNYEQYIQMGSLNEMV